MRLVAQRGRRVFPSDLDLGQGCDDARVFCVEGVMGRLGDALAILFTVGVFVIVGCGGDENDFGYEPLDVHAAETADERAAAELGERYAAAVDRDDLKTACELAIKRAAKRLHCGTSQPRATACSGRRAFHAKDEGDYIAVQLDMCALHVARHDGVWRVIEDVEMEAYG
jgi:hypothetical protein